MATATLDRVVHHCHVARLQGESFWPRDASRRLPTPPDRAEHRRLTVSVAPAPQCTLPAQAALGPPDRRGAGGETLQPRPVIWHSVAECCSPTEQLCARPGFGPTRRPQFVHCSSERHLVRDARSMAQCNTLPGLFCRASPAAGAHPRAGGDGRRGARDLVSDGFMWGSAALAIKRVVAEREPGASDEQADALRQRGQADGSGDTRGVASAAPAAESTAPSATAASPKRRRLMLRGRSWGRSSALPYRLVFGPLHASRGRPRTAQRSASARYAASMPIVARQNRSRRRGPGP